MSDVYSTVWVMQLQKKGNLTVFTGANSFIFRENEGKCECISMVHNTKVPQVCTEGSLVYANRLIRFYFLVHIFDSFFCVYYFLNFKVSPASAQKSNVYIIWFHVPVGFAHTDDMKINLYRYLYIYTQYLYINVFCCLEPLWENFLSAGVVLQEQGRCNVRVVYGVKWSLTAHNDNSGNGSVMCMDINKGVCLLFVSCESEERAV